MKEYLQPRDLCEAHILEAIDALAVALGIGATAARDCAAARRERLAHAAREIAAAQAANDGPTHESQGH
jgi:hypothetical protein